MCSRWLFLSCLIIFSSCSLSEDSPGISVFSASFDFNDSQEGWVADFTDLPPGAADSSFYELKFSYTDLPAHLGARKSMMLSGTNHSNDLFMFMKRKISGLAPNTLYNLVFEVELASNASEGSVGTEDSPGKSVFLKAGASDVEPVKTIQSNQYVLNIDKGNQSTSGRDAVTLGDIAVPASYSDYALISRSNASGQPFIAKSNNDGEMWLIIGTESGYMGTTTVYYTAVNVLFSASY